MKHDIARDYSSVKKSGNFTGLGCYVWFVYEAGGSEVQISGRSNRTQCCERLATAPTFFLKGVVLPAGKMIQRWASQSCYQRWSRGHKARGQGQGHGHKKNWGQGQGQPFRGQTLSRPRTGMLEAKVKDTAARVLQKKVFKKVFQAISYIIVVAKIFDWEGLNHKSHATTSSTNLPVGT